MITHVEFAALLHPLVAESGASSYPSQDEMAAAFEEKRPVVVKYFAGSSGALTASISLQNIKGTEQLRYYEARPVAYAEKTTARMDIANMARLKAALESLQTIVQGAKVALGGQTVRVPVDTPAGRVADLRDARDARDFAQAAYDADPSQGNTDALSAAQAAYDEAVANVLAS